MVEASQARGDCGQTSADVDHAGGAKIAYIEPASPWENGFVESFTARLRDKPLTGGKGTKNPSPFCKA